MNMDYSTRYKECDPLETVERIRKILAGLDVLTIENWEHDIEDYYSLNMRINGIENVASNGKGTTVAYALASAYAELLERLQNLVFVESNIGMSEKAFNHLSFHLVPDEKVLDKRERMYNIEKCFTDLNCNERTWGINNKTLDRWRTVDENGPWDDYTALPYMNIMDGNIYYLPISLVVNLYGTNGMCAGNTGCEALVQGLSEVVERYVQKKIIMEKIVPPTIPESYIMEKYPYLYKMIKELERKGDFKVIAKDCSLGQGFPVTAIFLLDRKSNSYFIRFGCHPVFEIALERCLTELLQGKSIYNLNWMVRLSFSDKDIYSSKNLTKVFIDGLALHPLELFTDNFSYEFTCIKDMSGCDNNKMLLYLVDILKPYGCNILVRDVSFLGFPSYHIIVPFFSEMVDSDHQYFPSISGLWEIARIMMRLGKSSDNELRQVIDLLVESGYNPQKSIIDLLHRSLSPNFPWSNVKLDLFLSSAYYRLGDYKKAYEAMERFINIMESQNSEASNTYFSCVKDFFGALVRGIRDTSRIRGILTKFYPESIVEKVLTGLSNPNDVFRNYSKLECFNCTECSYTKWCYYPQREKLFMKLKEVYARNVIDQSRVARIF